MPSESSFLLSFKSVVAELIQVVGPVGGMPSGKQLGCRAVFAAV